jgi:AbrB family looped-hinge helix DNA binding protein
MPVVTMSSKGQIVIPQQIRRRIGLREGSRVNVEATEDGVLLRPTRTATRGWRRWRGAFAGKALLKALRREHAAEIVRDAARRR